MARRLYVRQRTPGPGAGAPEVLSGLRHLHAHSGAAILALEGPQEIVEDIRATYEKRRDTLCDGLVSAGWAVNKPKATMFVWARIPELYRSMGSLEFSKKLLAEAKVAVSPGIGFGEYGDEYVRFSLIENENRTRQAIRCIRDMLKRNSAGTLAKGKRPA